MFCSIDADNYRGLDSDRDTKEEVETAIRFFPNVLTRNNWIIWDDDDDEIWDDDRGVIDYWHPIQLLAFTLRDKKKEWICNTKAVSFIPLLVRL
jgi:hypothetical protein